MYRSFATASIRRFADADTTIRGLTQDLCTAFNTGNYDQSAALFASDGQLMPPNHEAVQGSKAIERFLRDLGESGQDLRFETTRIILGGDMAIEVGRYTSTLSQANHTIMPQYGKYLRIWRRLGQWLIAADCWNSNLPAGKEVRSALDDPASRPR